jgi:hypothetical protein
MLSSTLTKHLDHTNNKAIGCYQVLWTKHLDYINKKALPTLDELALTYCQSFINKVLRNSICIMRNASVTLCRCYVQDLQHNYSFAKKGIMHPHQLYSLLEQLRSHLKQR